MVKVKTVVRYTIFTSFPSSNPSVFVVVEVSKDEFFRAVNSVLERLPNTVVEWRYLYDDEMEEGCYLDGDLFGVRKKCERLVV